MNQILVSAGQNARPNLATATSCPTNGHFAQSVTGVQNDTRPSNVAQKPATSAQTASERKKSQPHLRRTIDQVKEKWRLGDYTPSGYLVELFSAMKAEGFAIVIRNVQAFCEEWGLSRRTFFRAKATLVSQGRLDEEIQGTLIVRLIPINSEHLYDDKVGTDGARSGTHDDKVGTDGARSGTHDDKVGTTTPANPTPESRFEDSPDLYSDLKQITNNSLSQPTHPPEREFEKSFSKEIEEEFREWLTKKAHQLPYKPTLVHQWVNKQMKQAENRAEFLKYREALTERINFPPAPANFPTKLDDYALYPLVRLTEAEQRLNDLARLRTKWHQPAHQAAAIAEATRLGFVTTEHGIEEA
jgi:hypothetical protein